MRTTRKITVVDSVDDQVLLLHTGVREYERDVEVKVSEYEEPAGEIVEPLEPPDEGSAS